MARAMKHARQRTEHEQRGYDDAREWLADCDGTVQEYQHPPEALFECGASTCNPPAPGELIIPYNSCPAMSVPARLACWCEQQCAASGARLSVVIDTRLCETQRCAMSAESQKRREARRAQAMAMSDPTADAPTDTVSCVAIVQVPGGMYSARRYEVPMSVLEPYEIESTAADLRGFVHRRVLRMLGIVPE